MKRTGPRAGRPAASPWALGGLSVPEFGRRVYARVWQGDILNRAAELSYYFAFALVPTLLVLTTLLGLLPLPDLMPQLVGYFDRVLPDDAASLIKKTLDEVVSGASGRLLSIGVLGALLGASSGMLSIMNALNAAYGIADDRTWWRKRLVALALTVMFSLFTLTTMLLFVFGGRIGEAAAERMGVGPAVALAWALLQWPLVIVPGLTGLSLVYSLAPARQRRWSWITPGSAFAMASWLLMSVGLRFYVNRFADYNATYGSIGGVILLMLWLYWSGVALLVGAEIDSTIERAAIERALAAESRLATLAAVSRDS
jgi:membrane protein